MAVVVTKAGVHPAFGKACIRNTVVVSVRVFREKGKARFFNLVRQFNLNNSVFLVDRYILKRRAINLFGRYLLFLAS